MWKMRCKLQKIIQTSNHNLTVDVICSVTPKEYTSNTEAAIVIDGTEHSIHKCMEATGISNFSAYVSINYIKTQRIVIV